MALKKCKECGSQVSTKALSCPKCGAVLKKKTGCLVKFLVGIFLLFCIVDFLKYINGEADKSTPTTSSSGRPSLLHQLTESQSSTETEPNKIYQEGQTFKVGYTTYMVKGSLWADHLDTGITILKPNAMYLIVQLSVCNNDTQPRTIPPFQLIDKNNSVYETSADGWMLNYHISNIDSLNPSVTKDGIILFDVPQRNYALKLSGGYWSTEKAFVKPSIIFKDGEIYEKIPFLNGFISNRFFSFNIPKRLCK